MRFYDRYNQLILKGDKPFYSDVKHIHSNSDSKDLTGVIRRKVKDKYVKDTVILPSGGSVWMMPESPTTITGLRGVA